MLTPSENQLLTQVGPDAPMGRMLRRYWIPALMSEELPEPDGAPRRIRLLSEDLLAFRDTVGRAGILDEHCPHRGASLALGRNEEGGLRCLYHGWKFDVAGNCLDTPAEPLESTFVGRVKALSYLVHEQGGLIWVYMGPPKMAPRFPDFAFTTLPPTQRAISKFLVDANWVQSLEGVIDSAHSDFLHADDIKPSADVSVKDGTSRYSDADDSAYLRRPSRDHRPRMEIQETDYGFRYAAIRNPIRDPDQYQYVRVTLFVAPFYGLFPAPAGHGHMQALVPVDDEHTFLYFFQYSFHAPIDQERYRERNFARVGVDLDDRFAKLTRGRANMWLQDRAQMRGGHWSGIPGVLNQDQAVQESMGPIYDRSKEHLGATDQAIIRMRRLMLASVRRFEDGATPLGLERPVAYSQLQAEERIVLRETPWQAVGAFAGEPVTA